MSVVVLGAGLSGLSVAAHLSGGCRLFEREESVGGLCRSSRVNGFTFDRAGHLLHFKHPENLSFVLSLLGDGLREGRRNSAIWFPGTLIPYPFQAHFFRLPPAVASACWRDLEKACRGRRRTSSHESLHSWLLRSFGRAICERFLFPYNRKFWRYPLGRMSAEWARAWVPVPSLGSVRRAAAKGGVQDIGYNAVFWYPRQGGIQALCDALARKAGRIHKGREAVSIDPDRRRVTFADGSCESFETLVSTLPLPEFGERLTRAPRCVRAALRSLKHVRVTNVNLGLRRDPGAVQHWVYFPQKETIFYRLVFPGNFFPSGAPRGCSSLSAEISRRPGERAKGAVLPRLLRDLRRTGWPVREKDIACAEINEIPYAYCVYDRARALALKTILPFLRRHGIHSIGRYGGWRYASMEDVIAEGRRVAVEIASR